MNILRMKRGKARNRAILCVAGALLLTLFTPSAAPTKWKWASGPAVAAGGDGASGPQRRATPHLNYGNGPVLSNVRVVMVRYGAGTYLGNIAGTTTPTMASWYQQVVNSPYMDWLREYDTDVSGGTNQNIGRGSFVGTYQITPDSTRNGTTITDSNVQNELAAQLDAGHLPAADNNTIYMVHFPKGKILSSGGQSSCRNSSPNWFCAYHYDFTHNGQRICYAVQPDFSSGSGCDTGCGAGTEFQNQGYAASHELIETVTDPEPRSGWDDPVNDEIGDICNQQEVAFTGTDGNSYTVQKEWSNQNNACLGFPNANYYVNGATGNDANFGTPTHPYKTIRAAHNAIPANGMATINIAPGNYAEPPLPLSLNKNAQMVLWPTSGGIVHVGNP